MVQNNSDRDLDFLDDDFGLEEDDLSKTSLSS